MASSVSYTVSATQQMQRGCARVAHASMAQQRHSLSKRMCAAKTGALSFNATPRSMSLNVSCKASAASAASGEKVSYETMVVLRPDLTDEQRDSELAKFEAFLRKSGADEIQVTIRGRQRLAYPIKSFVDGIYVLYTFDANPQVIAPVQKLLSTPTAGAELNVLRHMTFRI